MAEVSRSSVSAILIASTMRVVLFLAVLGVVSKGVSLNPKNPAETPFEYVAGNFGQVLFEWLFGQRLSHLLLVRLILQFLS